MQKVVVAVDSFKGCLTSIEAGDAVAKGIRKVYPSCEVIRLPIADGGEGLLDVLLAATNGKEVFLKAHNPLMEIIDTRYVVSGDGETAIIEMSAISGLPLIPVERRNPMLTTTFGTGELIKDALEKGCRKFIIGIGGSATNDGGLGMLQALGYKLLDADGLIIETGGGQILDKVTDIDFTDIHPALKEARFTVACDVNNPFYGPNGAAYVYAKQKGASDEIVRVLDEGLSAWCKTIMRITKKDIAHHPGAGAAGGLGGGLLAFLNAELKPGIRLILDTLQFSRQIEKADLIITGEGRVDRQTAMGKVPSGVLEEAKKQEIPVIVIAGDIEDVEIMNNSGFQSVFSIAPGPVSLEKAMEPEFAKANIERLVSQVCRTIKL